MLDQEERLKALDPRCSWIVQAPAGSGKTELLVGRFLTVLAQVQEPEEVLAITFTRKAASEMQARVMGALKTNSDLAQKVLKQDLIRGWKLLENPGRLRISTIDSLCASLTAMLPMTARFGENFQVTEQAYLLYEKAVENLLQGLKEDLFFNQALRSCLLYLDNRLDKFKDLLVQMLSKRSMWLDIISRANSEHEWEVLLQKSLNSVIQESLENLQGEWPEDLGDDLWAMCDFSVGADLCVRPDREGVGASLKDFKSLADLLLTDKNQLRKKVDKRQGFLPKTPEKAQMESLLEQLESSPNYSGFIEQLIRIRILPSENSLSPQGLIQDLIQVLKAAVAYLKITFQSEKTVDFDEISLTALEALGAEDAPTDIMLRLDHQISHLLVDEYQDTSQLQYRLFSSMVRGWQKDDGRTVFLVGDPMQSIYKFRQADVGLFLKTIDQGLGPVKLNFIQLKMNFRSSPEIIDWINQSFEILFPKSKEGLFGAVTYAKSWSPVVGADLCVRPNGAGVKTILKTSSDLLGLELAQEILNYQEKYPTRKIALLVRSRNHLDSALQALAKFNIAYQGVEIQRLSTRSVILDCLNLTYAIFDLEDRLSWMALLRSPVFGFELKDLLLMGSQVPPLQSDYSDLSEQLSGHAQARLKLLMPIIQEVLIAKHRENLNSLIKKLWVSLGFLDYLKNLNQLEDIENAERYFDCLKKIKPRHQLPKREVLEKLLENLFAKSLNTQVNPIEIMTVHKSKGLEFDHVFIFMPNKTARALDKPLFLFQDRMDAHTGRHELLIAPHRSHQEKQDSPLYQFLYALEKEKENHEAIRLLYVAVTRAKFNLTLLGEIELSPEGEIKKPKSGSSLSWFWPVLNQDFSVPGSVSGSSVIDSAGCRLSPCGRDRPEGDAEGQRGDLNALENNFVFKRLNKNSKSPWVLNHGIATPDKEGVIFNHPEPPELNLEPKILGTIAHRYLEKLSLINPLPENINFLEKNIVQDCEFSGALEPEVMAQKIIKACDYLLSSERGRWILNPDHEGAYSELALWDLEREREFIIDRTFIDTHQKTRFIIDYKFSEPRSDQELKQELELYTPQLRNYEKLIKNLDQDKYPIKLLLIFPLVQKELELV